MPQLGTPSHLRLCGEKIESLVRGHEKTVADFRSGFRSIVGLFVEILIRLGSNKVAIAQSEPVFLSRSSNRRCFSSQ